ncbi:MAG: PepSY-associated TM helix domain-containing protein [Polyangiales bacterium]
MQTPGKKSELPDRRARWRPWLRAIHRDLGYVAVGLTLVYAASGLAVNHIAQWDPSFRDTSEVHELGPLPQGDDVALTRKVLDDLGIKDAPRDTYRSSDERVDILFDRRSLHVNPKTGHVVDEGQKPRFLLRVANWLHLNRGKKAWTYFADAYAAGLLFLAVSGMFMIAGKKGFFWRGAALVAIGLAVPTVYVVVSGGP